MRRLVRPLFIMAGVLLLGLWYIGYIGGTLFGVMPATAQASPHPRAVALYLSGDMGFHAGLGPDIVERLNRHGISVITENSLHYFRTRRTPEETGAMIADGLRRAIAIDPAAPLLLLGQSFGADVIAPSLPYVPKPLRVRIAFVGLVVPGATRQWRASPTEIFSMGEPEEDAVVAAQRLSWVPLLCIHGREEPASLCPSLHQRNATRIALPGGHALDHDEEAASAVLLQAIDHSLAISGQVR
ncbi:type IV secretion system protein VirJ [Sphingobium lactosutens]|uniref:AcvB/VirJ family lysyl-phosphatidylglycerol hydrolase n=1 Tax=Sphingobium lactosutens TaxID=522773 RepID=UPI0015C146E1|nr:AcvB/VirJ family lysyl-phosphatidylglycerol hydrolase [Sphingobium lactosutens]NWK97572.1 type IV secretion system protein VirJ [Sphingobium lactosutens]